MTGWVIREQAGSADETEIYEALKSAYSIECHEGHGIDILDPEYIGSVYHSGCPERLYFLYRGNGRYWYKTMYAAGDKAVPPYQYIFGHRKGRRR